MKTSSVIFSLSGDNNVDNIISSYNKLNSDIPLEKGDVVVNTFSDAEISVGFKSSVRGKKVYLYSSTNSNDDLIKIAMGIDNAKRASASEVILILLTLSYSRQDKPENKDNIRSAIGSKVIATMLESVGLQRLITLDLHAEQIIGYYNIPVDHLEGHNLFIPYVKDLLDNKIIENLTFLSPDAGGVSRVDKYFKKLSPLYDNITLAMISKRRDKPNSIGSMQLVGDVIDRDVILVDDLFDTFGTVKAATQLVIESGARSVRVIGSHGIFSGNAIKNINESNLTEIVISDSHYISEDLKTKINKPLQIFTTADMVAKTIMAINNGISAREILND